MSDRAPLLLPLPAGLCVSGVTTITLNMAGALAARGRAVTLVLHPEPAGAKPLDVSLDRRIRIIDLRHLPPLDTANGDLSPWLPAYREAVLSLYEAHGSPVVAFPNSIGDAFGLLAAISTAYPEALRIVGWQHNDIAYDARMLVHYEPVLGAMAACSHHLRERLAAQLPHRERDCLHVPYGVPVPLKGVRASRDRSASGTADRRLRLLYTGRLDHYQKRVGALPLLSDELASRGIAHTLNIVGDGPAREDLELALVDPGSASRRQRIMMSPALPPSAIPALLDEADLFILPSRFEGLSIAMLEAMARGCTPAVTRVVSGVGQAITHGVNGLIAETDPDADAASAAQSLAEVIAAALPSLPELSRAAHETVRDRFSLDRFADDVERLTDRLAAEPPRVWPADRSPAFTSRPGERSTAGSGTVPADAATRLRALLDSLAGRRIIIHGTGRHTLELADVIAGAIAESKVNLVAFADDDPAAAASRNTAALAKSFPDVPVIAPARAAADYAKAAGATDVVISSFIHHEAIYARRAVYEGARVHRLYD